MASVPSSPLVLFKSDIESDNHEYCVDAANKLTLVAVAIGQQMTLETLFPYITSILIAGCDNAHLKREAHANGMMNDSTFQKDFNGGNDEVFAAIARQLWNIYDIAQIYKLEPNSDTFKSLFMCLKILGEDEEIVIRDAAVESFLKILKNLPNECLITFVLPLFRSYTSNTEFGARYTAVCLLPELYGICQQQIIREELRHTLIAFSQDESPIVRGKVAKILPQFCEIATKLSNTLSYPEQSQTYDLLINTVVPILQQLSLDERDHLRSLVPHSLCYLIPFLPLKDYQNFFVPLLTALSDDLSWKVRQSLCQYLPLFIANLIKRATYQYTTESLLAYPNDKKEENEFKNTVLSGGSYDLLKYLRGIYNIYKILLLNDINIEVSGTGIIILTDMIYLSQGIVPDDLYTNFPREPIYTAEATENDSLILEEQFIPTVQPYNSSAASPSSSVSVSVSTVTSQNRLNQQPYQHYQRPQPTVNKIFKINLDNIIDDIGNGFYGLFQEISALSKVDLSEIFAKIAPFCGFEFTNRCILPIISILAQDDNVQVRSSCILALGPILTICPPQIVISQIWPLIESLGSDLRWRVRRSVTTQIATLCYHLRDNKAFIQSSVLPLVEGLLCENVHAVRNRMAFEFRSLISILGIDIINTNFLQLCRDLFNPKANYLHRITALHFIYFTCTAYNNSCQKEYINNNFTQYFLEALQDQVPNVRILAVRYVMELIKTGVSPWDSNFIKNNFLTHFESMANDHNQDREVIYQGTQALKVAKSM